MNCIDFNFIPKFKDPLKKGATFIQITTG